MSRPLDALIFVPRDLAAFVATFFAAPIVTQVLGSPTFWGAVVTGLLVFSARVIEIRAKVWYWKEKAQRAEKQNEQLTAMVRGLRRDLGLDPDVPLMLD